MSWTLFYGKRPWTTNAERRWNRYKRAEEVKEWREAFMLLAIQAKVPKLDRIAIHVTPVMPDRKFQDTAACNPASKAGIDGLVDAGVIDDDTPEFLGYIKFYPCVYEKGNPGLRLEIVPYAPCSLCSESFPQTEEFFYKHSQKSSGFNCWCIPCSKKKARESELRRREEDPEGFAAKRQEQGRKQKLAKYGLTPEGYQELLDAQGGACAICGATENTRKGSDNFHVDHDHRTGRVRGLLCHHCNVALGMVDDDPDRLNAMIAYLGPT